MAVDRELELLRKLSSVRKMAEYSRRLGLDPRRVAAQARRGRLGVETRGAMRGNVSRGVTMARMAMYRVGHTHAEAGELAATATPSQAAIEAVRSRREVINSWIGHGSSGMRNRSGRIIVIRAWAAKLGEDPPDWETWQNISPLLRGRIQGGIAL